MRVAVAPSSLCYEDLTLCLSFCLSPSLASCPPPLSLFLSRDNDLPESQWLPSPYASFDAFQHYLMGLWGPSMFSIVSYCFFYSYMERVSLMEVISPLMIYFIIGTYIATISGYEHPKLVLRRLNMHLSSGVCLCLCLCLCLMAAQCVSVSVSVSVSVCMHVDGCVWVCLSLSV